MKVVEPEIRDQKCVTRGQDGDLSWIEGLPEKIVKAMTCASFPLPPCWMFCLQSSAEQ